jgi:small subunit ribosomal protein S2
LGGKKVLFVGTKNESKGAIRLSADALNMPYVCERWVGGIFTNFPEIKKRIARMKDLASKKEKGELDVYTKKERLILQWEEDRLIKLFGGLADMTEKPAVLVVVDPKKEKNAIAEAKKVNVPVIALMNTDCDYSDATFPIPGNDTSTKSIEFVLNQLVSAYRNK